MSVSNTVLRWSRRVAGLACVTNELRRSSTCMRSPYTRYGLIGVSSEFMTCRYLARASSRAALTSAATFARWPSGTGRAVRHFLAERLQGQARIADHRVRRGIHLVDMQFIDVAVDDGLLRRIGNGVAEAIRPTGSSPRRG